MVLLNSDPVELGASAPDFNALPATDGKSYGLASFAEHDVLVVAFICNHCPYVIATIDRLVDLHEAFKEKGVGFIGVSVNDVERYPADGFPNMVAFSQERKMRFPYLYDASQKIARDYGAVCTPDLFVFDKDRKLCYRGRIDDNWKDATAATQHDLADALTALVNGEAVASEQKPSMGCSIKWKPGS